MIYNNKIRIIPDFICMLARNAHATAKTARRTTSLANISINKIINHN